jgi:hypothetical protein
LHTIESEAEHWTLFHVIYEDIGGTVSFAVGDFEGNFNDDYFLDEKPLT